MKDRKQELENIKKTVEFACGLKSEDLVWHPLYANNMLRGELLGYYTLILKQDSDGKFSGRKYTILFQYEDSKEDLGLRIGEVELYVLFEKNYSEIIGPLAHPEPSEKEISSSALLASHKSKDTFTISELRDFGSFVHAYADIEDAKRRAVVQYRAVFGYAMSHLIPDDDDAEIC